MFNPTPDAIESNSVKAIWVARVAGKLTPSSTASKSRLAVGKGMAAARSVAGSMFCCRPAKPMGSEFKPVDAYFYGRAFFGGARANDQG